MPTLFFWIVVFIASLLALVKASNLFIESAERIGAWLGFSSFVIGTTIVAIGTSLPELASSLAAVFADSSEIVVGDVIGSNIANITLILGLAMLARRRITIIHPFLGGDIFFLIISAVLLGITIINGSFSRAEGLFFVILLGLYLYYLKRRESFKAEEKESPKARTILAFTASLILIYLGAKYTIKSVIEISSLTGIGVEVIAASAIALGTSLPELTVSLAAVIRGKTEISVGDLVGSNIFNTFGVMGIPAMFSNLIVPESMLSFGLPLMLIVTFLVALILLRRELHMLEGFLLIGIYIFFIGKLYFG